MNRMKDLRPRWHQGIAASSPWSLSDLIWSTDVSNFAQTPLRQRAKTRPTFDRLLQLHPPFSPPVGGNHASVGERAMDFHVP